MNGFQMPLFSEEPTGNIDLVASGIQTEESDYRVHIDFEGKVAFLFPTEAGRAALATGLYESYNVSSNRRANGLVTARGARVPAKAILGSQCINMPTDLHVLRLSRDTSVKGRLAQDAYSELRARGLLSVPDILVTDVSKQRRGADYRTAVVQVKCDNGALTRGLFLQTHECNPHRQY